MPQLDFAHYPFLSQFFWLFVSFAILYFYSAKVILPRISKTLETRDKTIKDALNEAERIKEDANSYMLECENLLDEARVKSAQIISEAKDKVSKKAKSESQKIDKKITEKISDAAKRIADFKVSNKKAITDLSDEIYNNLIKKYVS